MLSIKWTGIIQGLGQVYNLWFELYYKLQMALELQY